MDVQLRHRVLLAERFWAEARSKARGEGERRVIEMMIAGFVAGGEMETRRWEATVHARCSGCGTVAEIVYRADPPSGGWFPGCGVETEQTSYSGCGC